MKKYKEKIIVEEYRGFKITLTNREIGKRYKKIMWTVSLYDDTKNVAIKYSSNLEKYHDAVIEGKKQVDKIIDKDD